MKPKETSQDVLGIVLAGRIPDYVAEDSVMLALCVGEIECGDIPLQSLSKEVGWVETSTGMANAIDVLFPVSPTRYQVDGMNIKSQSGQVLYHSKFPEPRETNAHTQLFFPVGSIKVSES